MWSAKTKGNDWTGSNELILILKTYQFFYINLTTFNSKLFKTVLEQLEHDLQEVNSNKDALKKNYLELQELRHILTKATNFFDEVILLVHIYIFFIWLALSIILQWF